MASHHSQSPGSPSTQPRDDADAHLHLKHHLHGRHHAHSFSRSQPHQHQHSHHHLNDLTSASPATSDNIHERDAAPKQPPQAQYPPADLPQNPTVSYYTHVIQTIQLIYGTDAAGLPAVQTVSGTPATVVVDSHTGETIAAISSPDEQVTPPASTSVAEPTSTSTSEPASADPSTAATPPPSTSSSSEQSSSAVTSSATGDVGSSALTTAPVPSSGTISTHHGQNTTHTPHSVETSRHSSTNITSVTALDLSTTLTYDDETTTSTYSTTHFTHTTLSSLISSSSFTESETQTATATETQGTAGGGGGSTGGSSNDSEDAAEPSTTAESNSDPLTPQQKQIVGGVVGGIAGAAFFLLLILLVLRWRKRKQARAALGSYDGGGAASRGVGSSGSGGGGGGGGSIPMSQRSVMPSAISAALASLTGKSHGPSSPEAPPPTGEQGFYRVSGRKLTSVLQSGGDGYSDPHASIGSGASDYYRGSQAFEPDTANRLALGSPMRPVSGVVIMRDGPGRTPVHQQNPFSDPDSPTRGAGRGFGMAGRDGSSPPQPPPPPPPGTLGRSLVSQDGSRGSGSRFQERI